MLHNRAALPVSFSDQTHSAKIDSANALDFAKNYFKAIASGRSKSVLLNLERNAKINQAPPFCFSAHSVAWYLNFCKIKGVCPFASAGRSTSAAVGDDDYNY